MGPRLTTKGYVYLASFAALLLASILLDRWELVLIASTFMFGLFAIGFETDEPKYSISAKLTHDRCFEGEEITLEISIVAESTIPLLEAHVLLCDEDNHVMSSRVLALSMKPGEVRNFLFSIDMPVRGMFYVGDVVSRSYSRSCLKSFGDRVWPGQSCLVYPRPVPIRIDWGMVARSRQHVGESPSRIPGEGLEISDIRAAIPGDSVRRVNWRATMRLGKLYVNDSTRDRNIDMVIVVDGLDDVGTSPSTYLDCASRAASSIAMGFLENRDRVGLIRYAGAVDWVVPRPGRNQLYAILGRLASLRTVQSFVAPNMKLLPRSVLPPGSLVLVITPLLDERAVDMIVGLAARGCNPMVLFISPIALVEDRIAESTNDQLAKRWWDLSNKAKVNKLRALGLRVAEWDGRGSLDACLNHYYGGHGFRSATRSPWQRASRGGWA